MNLIWCGKIITLSTGMLLSISQTKIVHRRTLQLVLNQLCLLTIL